MVLTFLLSLFYYYFALFSSEFTRDALQELEKFSDQKFGDFRSMLINYVQLQLHIHKKVRPRTTLYIYLMTARPNIKFKPCNCNYLLTVTTF